MAEAVGLMASIVAVAGLAKTVLNFVDNTKQLARDLKTVREELLRSVRQVGNSAKTIHLAQDTLSKYCKKMQATGQSEVISYVEKNETIYNCFEEESYWIKKDVYSLEDEIFSLLDIRLTIRVTWKWRGSLKDKIEAIRTDMDFLQTSLGLVLNCVQLNVEMRRADRNEIEM